jgi:hypothetical protein
MPQTRTVYPVPGVLPVVIVIAASTVAAMVIAAWLVHQVARQAIDKVPPEGVAPVILALGALLNPLRLFLPWPNRGEQIQPPYTRNPAEPPLHNETCSDLSQEVKHEA